MQGTSNAFEEELGETQVSVRLANGSRAEVVSVVRLIMSVAGLKFQT